VALAVFEVYSNKWGQCQCYKSSVQKMYFRFMDHVKFYKVATDDVKLLANESQFEVSSCVVVVHSVTPWLTFAVCPCRTPTPDSMRLSLPSCLPSCVYTNRSA